MPHSAPVDGFRLAHDRYGDGDRWVLLHAWPGDHTDSDALVRCWSGAPPWWCRTCAGSARRRSSRSRRPTPAPRRPRRAACSACSTSSLFPRAWSDRLPAFFSAVELEPRVGQFSPVGAPRAFAAAIRRRLSARHETARHMQPRGCVMDSLCATLG
jgi:hypothetical protein